MPLLTFRMGLTKRAKRVESEALIAQRLKRFSSVMNKLSREPTMKLSQMHDLGGCDLPSAPRFKPWSGWSGSPFVRSSPVWVEEERVEGRPD
jgi:hypothetical protein